MKNILITPEGIKTNLKNVKPLEAICEYIWNGFDAGASQIKVYLHTNELGLINMVSVIDNGTGIVYHELPYKFQPFGVISDGISQIQNFQDNEYRSRVFSLVAHVKKIADFQTEILENDELRLSKIAQLDSLEEECTKLLGQANLTLAGFAKKSGLNYDGYEKALGNAQNWFMYQQSLLEILYKISDLRYTLHLGIVSREQCMALLPTYSKQVSDTQTRLTAWHEGTADRLGIEADESRRKRAGFDGVIHFIPGLFNDNLNFREIEEKTASMITAQKAGHVCTHKIDKSELYAEDVQLISKDGKIYYLPVSKAE